MESWPQYLSQESFDAGSIPDPNELGYGQYFLMDAGISSEVLGSKRIKLHVSEPGMCGPLGLFAKGKFKLETTFYALNPMYVNNHDSRYNYFFNLSEEAKRNHVKSVFDYVILCANQWDNNYQHFLTETLPIIHYFSRVPSLNNLPFIVSNYNHIKEIVGFLYPSINFIFLDACDFVDVNNKTFSIDFSCRNFDKLEKLSIEAFSFLRNKALEKFSGSSENHDDEGRAIYIGRRPDGVTNGNIRPISNENSLFDLFREHDIHHNFFDGKSIEDKVKVLDGVEKIISPIGANMMNLIYCHSPVKILCIEHPFFSGSIWFRDLLTSIGVEVECFVAFSDVHTDKDTDNHVNGSYHVDMEKFKSSLINNKMI